MNNYRNFTSRLLRILYRATVFIFQSLTPSIKSNDLKAILVIRQDRIGDFISTIPLLQRLKQQYPKGKVYAVCSSLLAPLAQEFGYDDVFALDCSLLNKARQNPVLKLK